MGQWVDELMLLTVVWCMCSVFIPNLNYLASPATWRIPEFAWIMLSVWYHSCSAGAFHLIVCVSELEFSGCCPSFISQFGIAHQRTCFIWLLFLYFYFYYSLHLKTSEWMACKNVTNSWGYDVILIPHDWILRLVPLFLERCGNHPKFLQKFDDALI